MPPPGRIVCQQLLKKLLQNRLGRFVPTETDLLVPPSLCPTWHFQHSPSTSTASTISPDDLSTRAQVKQFMRETFYREGPIPRALQLGEEEEEGSPRLSAFLDKEMDMYLGSGISVVVRDSSLAVSGVALSALWRRDDAYEVIGADAASWHTAAAEIASEVDPEESRLVWRDYQFQHLYDLCQKAMGDSGREWATWLGMLSFSPRLRGSGMTDVLVKQAHERTAALGGVFGTQSNFRAFDRHLHKSCKNPVVVDEMMYGDERLIFRGEEVFKRVQYLGAIQNCSR